MYLCVVMEIKRTLYQTIRSHLDKPEITLLIGPRQAGKTTLLREIAENLVSDGQHCFFFNLDIDVDAQYFRSQQTFVERVVALAGQQKAYIFIDEVQRIENAGLFLKGLYDRRLPYKWVATGSGSLELKEKIAESLAGRKRNFYLFPVSLAEFTTYSWKVELEQSGALLRTDTAESEHLLRQYLLYGGYPRVVTASDAEEKKAVLSEIFQSYIERDIQILLRLEKSKDFITLLQLVANRIGKLINFQDLSNLTNLSVPTVKNYLWYCEKTFIIESVLPFYTNKEKELVKSPQYYFTDAGLRNHLLAITELVPQSNEFGFLFQQLVFQLLKAKFDHSVAAIRYWRTQNQAEVDFVVQKGLELLPVEVKSAQLQQPEITRSLRSFIEMYHPAEAWIVNRSLEATVQVGDTAVRFLPWQALVV